MQKPNICVLLNSTRDVESRINGMPICCQLLGVQTRQSYHASQARAGMPLHVGPSGFVGFTYFRAGRYQEALRESEEALTLEPDSPIANWFRGQILAAQRRFEEAANAFSIAVDHSPGASMYLATLAYANAKSGESARASEILMSLQRDLGPLCFAFGSGNCNYGARPA